MLYKYFAMFHVSRILPLLTLFLLLLGTYSEARNFYVDVNPNCTSAQSLNISGNPLNLLYVRSDGGDSDSTYHYLWNSHGLFTMLAVETSRDTELVVDCEAFKNFKPESIYFTKDPLYSSALIITKLWLYEDVHDNVDIAKVTNDSYIFPHYLTDFKWQVADAYNVSSQQVKGVFQVSSDDGGLVSVNGTSDGSQQIQLTLSAFTVTDHADEFPRLIHKDNNFQFEMIIRNAVLNGTSNNRFAVELGIWSSEKGGEFTLQKTRSIDDEYTPGVFTVLEFLSTKSKSNQGGCYLQYKPVCYSSTDRTTESSLDTIQNNGAKSSNETVQEERDKLTLSLLYAFYGDAIFDSSSNLINGWMNVSFGTHGDDFYDKKKLLIWTASFGMGSPPEEKFSTLVIAIIIVGFGVPALFIVTGGVIILVRRCRSRDDDLNLSSDRLVDDIDNS